MKTRILSYLLVFSMTLALLPASALAEGESTTKPHIPEQHVTATVEHAFDNSGAETGQITAQIEAYLTDKDNQSRTVKPCDIIFLIEQSTFMNTQTDTTQYGQERADILNSMESLLQNLPTPTTGDEHRVAIAGFGRINNSGTSDSYIENQHPGTKLTTDKNPSLNTGYYTCENNAPDFHSKSGWTEWDRITDHDNNDNNDNNDKTTLPQMPTGYLSNESYDKVFMSVSDAMDVIDVDKIVSWHAGASRMDAGLQITEQLAKIAQAHKATDEDRNLIIFVAASSLPYQNSASFQNLRPEAAQAAATKLKGDYGATIFGFGDFRALNLKDLTAEKQRELFNATMAGICGNSTTQDGTPYFKGLSQVHDIDAALNELLIQIDANVNPNTKSLDIDVKDFQEKSTAHTSHPSHTWKELKEKHHILTSSAINETASVDYYRFTGYDANNNPQFATTPYLRIERSLSNIGSGDSIQTTLSLQPIPPAKTEGTAYGVKAVITITDPVCVDYEWAGRWTPDFDHPSHEHAARGVKHSPATPTQKETNLEAMKMKLKFDGWYRLWDDNIDYEGNGKKTWTYEGTRYVAYQDNVYDAFGSDLTLYGRWIPYIDVNFQWSGSVPEDAELPSTVPLELSDSKTVLYTPDVPSQEGYEFDGWYKDPDCTKPYSKKGETLTENTTLYGSWTKIGTKAVTFTVVNGSWNKESAWYQNKIGDTDTDTAPKTVTVNVPLRNGIGTLTPDLVPQVDNKDMKPDTGYKASGTWEGKAPDTNTDAITKDGTYAYTYTFPEADTYTITYLWVPGTEVPEDASLPAQQKDKESSAGTKPTFTIAPEPHTDETGWTFDGWYTVDHPNPNTKPITGEYNFAGNDTKNLTLYGKWTHEPCTVTFYADSSKSTQRHFNTDDNNTDDYNNTDGYSISYKVPYGSTLAEVPTPVTESAHTDYFEGWRNKLEPSLLDTQEEQEDTQGEQEDTQDAEDADEPATHAADSSAATGTFYTSSEIQNMTIKSDLNFVAQWWPIVTFDANGGKWVLDKGEPTERYVLVPANKNHIDSLRPPAREGYTFLGWYDTSGEPIDFKIRPFDGAETVYAHWAKNATVTFKIVNGYWSGNTAEDKTVTVVLHPQANGSASGTLDANHVPAIMIPAAGYENTPGHWDVTPNTEENGISGNVTYTYIFGKKHHSSSDDDSKDKDKNKDKDNNKDNNTGETTPTKVPALLNGSNHFAYVVGYKDGNVRPQGNITRAETAAIFFRLLKEEVRSENLSKHNDFADVTEDSWYNTAVSTMAGMNILKGRTANSFVPQAPITRAEFAAICARFDSGKAEENSGFTDISGHWAEKEIERAATLGWVSGYTDGSFHPDAPITRAEAMTLINRVLCRMPETKADLLDSMTKWPDNQPGAWYYLAVQEATNSHTYEQKDSKYETWTALTAEPDWSKY